MRLKHIPHQAAGLTQIDAAVVASGDARRVLATVLQNGQTVVQGLIDTAFRYDSDDPAHGRFSSKLKVFHDLRR